MNRLLKPRKQKMEGGKLEETIGMREELINKACSLSLKAHKASKELYFCKKSHGEAVFSFPGSWSVEDWFSSRPFGDTKVNLNLFPSLRSIGLNEEAMVNEAFFRRFEVIHKTPSFQEEVRKAVTEKKQIVFTGHSSGGPMAILATLWFLEEYTRPKSGSPSRSPTTPLCVTFGSPLVGDRIIPHALRRENWDTCFINFVMRYDIVPRLMLAPLSSIERELQPVLHFFNPKFEKDSVAMDKEDFFINVMRNVSSVANRIACNLMGSTNPLLENITSFIELSPYRPFGTYIFCSGNGKLVVAKNSDAVFQILCHSCQLQCEAELTDVADKSLKQHLAYADELQGSLKTQRLAYLDNYLNELPLCSDGSVDGEMGNLNTALNDIGVSTRGRLCLRAAGELQKKKQRNQDKINQNKIEEEIKRIESYQEERQVCKVGYYDSFKLQNLEVDFKANVSRLELAGTWDEIIEMLKRYELPDEFEGQKGWIELGTKMRKLVEPLDIANYYRHSKNDDTGPYIQNGRRPKRYRFTQQWREHDENMGRGGSRSESCFWATVEELSRKNYEDTKKEIVDLETNLEKWIEKKEIGKDVILDDSTFSKWWKTLPSEHRKESCIARLMMGN